MEWQIASIESSVIAGFAIENLRVVMREWVERRDKMDEDELRALHYVLCLEREIGHAIYLADTGMGWSGVSAIVPKGNFYFDQVLSALLQSFNDEMTLRSYTPRVDDQLVTISCSLKRRQDAPK